MRNLTISLLLSIAVFYILFSSCSEKKADPALMEPFKGTWVVDIDRTIEDIRKTPEYNPDEPEFMAIMRKKMLGSIKLNITDTEVIHIQYQNEVKAPYTLKSASEGKVVIGVTADQEPFEAEIMMLEEGRMKLTSPATRKMDIYTWKRETKE